MKQEEHPGAKPQLETPTKEEKIPSQTPTNQQATPKAQLTPKQKEVEDLLKRYSELDMNDENNLKQ